METDASIKGLGAVLSQLQGVHPVAYASRSLTQGEKGYAITELETLAVVWGISHFHAYLGSMVMTSQCILTTVLSRQYSPLPVLMASMFTGGARCLGLV